MAQRNYTRRVRSARSDQARPKQRHQKGPTRRLVPRARPFSRHFLALQSGEVHPVDAIIDAIPEVAALDRQVLRTTKRWQGRVADPRAFINFIDARLARRSLRQEVYFDAGFEQGLVAGRAESEAARADADDKGRKLARAVDLAILSSSLPLPRALAILLELARAMALGKDASLRRGRRRGRVGVGKREGGS